eukprot:9467742-Pyramimonas_sp.AAC.2
MAAAEEMLHQSCSWFTNTSRTTRISELSRNVLAQRRTALRSMSKRLEACPYVVTLNRVDFGSPRKLHRATESPVCLDGLRTRHFGRDEPHARVLWVKE